MGFVALKRLHIGEEFKDPGDRLSADELKGRNVRMMVRLGQVSETADRARAKAAKSEDPPPPPPPDPKDDGSDGAKDDDAKLEDLTRKQLNKLAADAGVEAPEKLKSKPAVITALEELSAAKSEA